MTSIEIIGAGLAGCEAAMVLARNGVSVELAEMRPQTMTPAHKTALPAELVCSNSLKSNRLPAAQALLKRELEIIKSPLLECANACSVPSGDALAVDRLQFSKKVDDCFDALSHIRRSCREALQPSLEHSQCIIAAGPLASDRLVAWLTENFSSESLHFYDAIAPIISLDSIDTGIAFYASRYTTDNADYLNCPFTKEEYDRFYDALISADEAKARDFEEARFFEACLPIEVMARRGRASLSFGPFKPVGLIDPRTGKRPYAICQLRRENKDGDSFSLVAFQTRLTVGGQQKVVRLIPGLEKAEFLRFGSCHRNTYMDSPQLLSEDLSFKIKPTVHLAGQLCGNEGYTESIATGHLAALFALAQMRGVKLPPPPVTTACGALLRHVIASETRPFTPSSFHFGLLPALDMAIKKRMGKKEKHELLCKRALEDFKKWAEMIPPVSPLVKGGAEGGGISFNAEDLKKRDLVWKGRHLPYNPNNITKARELRKNMTQQEKKLWYGFLRKQKIRFLRQRPVDHYILDFYCAEHKLAIEIDGSQHYAYEVEKYDNERTNLLSAYGLKVLRFSNKEIDEQFQAVCERIRQEIPPNPP